MSPLHHPTRAMIGLLAAPLGLGVFVLATRADWAWLMTVGLVVFLGGLLTFGSAIDGKNPLYELPRRFWRGR